MTDVRGDIGGLILRRGRIFGLASSSEDIARGAVDGGDGLLAAV